MIQVDLTNPDAVATARDEVDAAVGRAHILVNNVGVYPNQRFEALTVEDWRAMFAVNVDTMFRTTRAFLPAMREQRDAAVSALFLPELAGSPARIGGPAS
jgi:all-trans-retinol dehydrogenase (NAD+)